MQKDELWEKFKQSGKIEDYLKYKDALREKDKN